MFKNKKIEIMPGSRIIKAGPHNETAQKINNFYSKNPFPNYENQNSLADLNDVKNNNSFLRNFKERLGLGKKIIEVGSGTSQLSIALAYGTNNQVVAFDATLESLRLGEQFAKKYNLQNCQFVLGDLFSDPFEKDYFDYVWCSGALHHTDNPQQGFEIISNWVKPEGYIIIGLYNTISRLRTNLRQFIFKLFGSSEKAKKIIYFIDPIIRQTQSTEKKDAWFNDQYLHPIESKHTLTEVLNWFDKSGIEYISSVPSCTAERNDMTKIFEKQDRGSFFSRMVSEIIHLLGRSGTEGGLFIVIGKKRTEDLN